MGMMFRNEDEMRLAALKGAILCDSDLTDVQPQPADIDRMESLMAFAAISTADFVKPEDEAAGRLSGEHGAMLKVVQGCLLAAYNIGLRSREPAETERDH
jgi:hypothetical protein